MLTFVGVGPGDPELMTYKAVRAIKEADIVAMADSGMGGSAVSRIAAEWLTDKTLLPLKMPMKGKRETWTESHKAAAATLAKHLDKGENIAYLVLGDPMLYATSSYLSALLQGYDIRVIPGITAMCAASSLWNVPLCEDREPLTILPGFDAGQAMPEDNVIIMKASGHLETILKAGGDRAMYLARNAGMENEYIGLLKDADLTVHAYFSTVLVKPR
ncbi:MAG: precorrin-2 C(20)-methyltransferase [Clostridia bacterium]|nr:precorrin-2 C(20)-methyltransferase [Clostridia bacterium]